MLAILATVLVTAAGGCGASNATVSGKVYYNGEPLKCGNVTFVSTDGKPSVSTRINEDGTYKFANVPSGNVKICVETESLNPEKIRGRPKYSPPPGQKAPEGLSDNPSDMTGRYRPIPEHFGDPEKSGLTLEVKRGNVQHDIKLEGSIK